MRGANAETPINWIWARRSVDDVALLDAIQNLWGSDARAASRIYLVVAAALMKEVENPIFMECVRVYQEDKEKRKN